MSARLRNRDQLPPMLPGFEAVDRYWDTAHEMPAATILPGQYYVTGGRELITTVLGCCVSACIRDRIFGIGGMNHFMLPISGDGKGWGGALMSRVQRRGTATMRWSI